MKCLKLKILTNILFLINKINFWENNIYIKKLKTVYNVGKKITCKKLYIIN